jgi:putative sterol carrier protein
MTKQEFADKLRRHQGWLPGKRIKLDFGDDGVVSIDGVAGRVSEEDVRAETVIGIAWSDWLALSQGRLEPMSAYMSGKLRVAGDLSDAIALGSLFKRLAD